MTTQISGTPKQVKYAEGVRSQLALRFGVHDLPDVGHPQFWIDSQDVRSIKELQERAIPYIGVINTPFTSTYPRYNRQDAIAAVKALGSDYAILDLETTGLKRNQDEIIEVAFLHADGSVLLDTLVRPLNRDQAVKAAIKGISKLELEDLEDAPTFDAIAPQITTILEKYHIVIYNASFDGPFIAYQYLKYGIDIPTIHATCCMRLASAWFNTDTNISLETVCKMLGVNQVEPAHRALSDCKTTLQVIQAMVPKPAVVPVNNSLLQYRERMQQVKLRR